jgi:hypothetical protein
VAEEGVIQPNPTNGQSVLWLNLRTKGVGTLQVLNSLGRIMQQTDVNLEVGLNHIPLDLSSYTHGMYMIVLYSKGKRYLFKLLKN